MISKDLLRELESARKKAQDLTDFIIKAKYQKIAINMEQPE